MVGWTNPVKIHRRLVIVQFVQSPGEKVGVGRRRREER